MTAFLDGAKLFTVSPCSSHRVAGYLERRKLQRCFRRITRKLAVFSCFDHKQHIRQETFVQPCPSKKRSNSFVSIILRLLYLVRISLSRFSTRSATLPYFYHSSSSLALLLCTTLRRGPFATSPFLSSLVEALTMVFMSEIGDKSMFATALLATRYGPWLVFLGSMVALTTMTGIACFLGNLMHLLPPIYTHYGSILLFVYFGIQMIRHSMKQGETSSEWKDAQALIGSFQGNSVWSIFGKIFLLIFTAEWCDRSMLATMALASSHSPLAIISGATIANIICSAIAVLGAALLSSKISEQKVSLVGGILFLFFGVKSFVEGPESQ